MPYILNKIEWENIIICMLSLIPPKPNSETKLPKHIANLLGLSYLSYYAY